jgi:hypothetical protein
MNFTYTLRQPPDNLWGSLQPDQSWNGMVGQLVDKEVDIGKKITFLKSQKNL